MKKISCLGMLGLILTSSPTWALEALNDEALSSLTGQDGLTISILPTGPIQADVIYHDNDGLDNALLGGTKKAGAIMLGTAGGIGTNPLSLSSGSANINVILDIDTDAGTTATGPFLNIGVRLPQDITINTGDIWVGASKQKTGITRGVDNPTKILDNMQFYISNMKTNIQLGATPQGGILKLSGIFRNGITITGYKLNDIGGGGSLALDNISIANSAPGQFGITNLDFDITAGVAPEGLKLNVNKLGDANGFNAMIWGARAGDANAKAFGDVELNGVNLNGTTLTVSGH